GRARLGCPDLSERARRFECDGGRRLRIGELLFEPRDRLRILHLPGGERDGGEEVGVGVGAQAGEQRAPAWIDDAAYRDDGAAAHFGVRRPDQTSERRFVELTRVLELRELDDRVYVSRRERRGA